MAKWLACLVVVLSLVGGCNPFDRGKEPARPEMFDPASMRIHPVFTQIKDWTGDGQADGIEALIELADQFGDPVKGSGTVLFELFAYRPRHPDPRGERIVNPWIGSIATIEEQRSHWSGTTQTYNFQLAWPGIDPSATYVLTATFESMTGKRYFDRTILTPAPQSEMPTTRPQ